MLPVKLIWSKCMYYVIYENNIFLIETFVSVFLHGYTHVILSTNF